MNHDRINGKPPLYRWSETTDVRSDYGLGGGISFAFDPQLCDLIIPQFPEGKDVIRFYEFVTCATIKEVVLSAFRTWAANNKCAHRSGKRTRATRTHTAAALLERRRFAVISIQSAHEMMPLPLMNMP